MLQKYYTYILKNVDLKTHAVLYTLLRVIENGDSGNCLVPLFLPAWNNGPIVSISRDDVRSVNRSHVIAAVVGGG